MSNQMIPIFLNLLAAVAGAFGQYFYKLGGTQMDVIPLYRNFYLFFGIILFCLVMVLFVAAFRLGGRMSIVYPVYATTFIWGTLIAVMIGKESWSIMQLFGVATIVAGVIIIAMAATE
jgi:multidrug transporter EmrE-like cation transporter